MKNSNKGKWSSPDDPARFLTIKQVGDEDDYKSPSPLSDFLLFTGAKNFANLILSDLLTLIKLQHLHVQHSGPEFWEARNIYEGGHNKA